MGKSNHTILSAIILSSDEKILLVRDSAGPYSGCWHNIGCNLKYEEECIKSLLLKISEIFEILRLKYIIKQLAFDGHDGDNKFIYFEIIIEDKLAEEINIKNNNKSKDIQWFAIRDLEDLNVTLPGEKLYRKLGYIK